MSLIVRSLPPAPPVDCCRVAIASAFDQVIDHKINIATSLPGFSSSSSCLFRAEIDVFGFSMSNLKSNLTS